MLDRLEAAWTARWAGTPPVGHLLRGLHRERWVRFHGLPESKRYPDSEQEYATIINRHHTLLDELGLGERCFVTQMFFTDDLLPAPAADEIALPRASLWCTLPPGDGEELAIALYASEIAHPSKELDLLFRAVIDDQIVGVIVVPMDAAWLYHPYDGGVDIIAASSLARDVLREKFHAWLSPHPRGL